MGVDPRGTRTEMPGVVERGETGPSELLDDAGDPGVGHEGVDTSPLPGEMAVEDGLHESPVGDDRDPLTLAHFLEETVYGLDGAPGRLVDRLPGHSHG
jgi:hypothetical protein